MTFAYQDELEEGSKTTANYVHALLLQPMEMKLELVHLNDRADVHVLSFAKEEARPTQALRAWSNAA